MSTQKSRCLAKGLKVPLKSHFVRSGSDPGTSFTRDPQVVVVPLLFSVSFLYKVLDYLVTV